MMKKLLCSLLILPLFVNSSLADERSDRYKADVEAVKKPLFSKKGRHELTPMFAMSTNDAFYQNYYVGLTYSYHLANWISIGILANASFDQPTGLTKTLEASPAEGGFGVKPDVRRAFNFSTGALEVRIAPVYGKLNFFSEAVVHFDIFLLLTGGVFLTQAPAVTGPAGSMGIHPFGGGGVGQRYFLLNWLAFRWEFRVIAMPESFENRGNETRARINMDLILGFSFFF